MEEDQRSIVENHVNSNGHAVQLADNDSITSKDDIDIEATSCLTTPGWAVCRGVHCMDGLQLCLTSLLSCVKKYSDTFKRVFCLIAVILWISYLIWALYKDAVRARPLLGLSVFILLCVVWFVIGEAISRKATVLIQWMGRACGKTAIKWMIRVLFALVFVGIVLTVALFVKPRPQQLISLAGLVVFLLFLLVFSKYPSKVRVRTIFSGLLLQFMLGIILIRTSWGSAVAGAAGEQAQKFIAYSDRGAEFVFGETYTQHKFAFKILPVVIYFSGAVSILYHIGVMQVVIRKVAWIMKMILGTSATESVCAAGNIFVGMTEAPILVRPFIKEMTISELHAMMTTGFATIAGSVLAVYIMFGVSARHLMSACVMNAPMALTAAKLFYPENDKTESLDKEIEIGKSECQNVLDAASTGATMAIKLVGNIAANLIVFIGLLSFINAVFSWFGSMVDYPELSFQMLLSYIYLPVVLLMGVDWADAGHVSELLGMKTFINEFIAYEHLAGLIHNRKHCLLPHISVRSEVISTYALCGFANLCAIGIQLGGLRALAPSRSADITKIAVRALVAGTVTCFMTASVAGLLAVEEEDLVICTSYNFTTIPTTTNNLITY